MRNTVSRRDVLAQTMAAAGMVAIGPRAYAGSPSPQCPSVAPPPAVAPALAATPLGTIAANKNLLLGVQLDIAANPTYGPGMYDPVYRQAVFAEKPAFISYGSAFKFGTVCPDPPLRGALSFTQRAFGVTNTWYAADDLTNFIKPQGVRARAEALIWNDPAVAPPWLKALPRGTTTLSPLYRNNLSYVATYMSAALKKMTQLQGGQANFFHSAGLVNEPIVPNFANRLSPTPAYYRAGPWLAPGQIVGTGRVPDYIHDAFFWGEYYRSYWAKALRQPATTAKFFLNETLCETDQYGPVMRPALLALLKAMIAERLTIRGVGLECHLQPQMMNDPYHPDWTAFGAFIQAIGTLGLEVYITELDVLDYETSCFGQAGSPQNSDTLIDVYYDTFLRKVLSYPNVKSVTLWDLSDRYTFYRDLDVATWYGYNQIPQPRPVNTPWPACASLPASASAIACPRPDAYDDTMTPKAARQTISDAISAAPPR